MILQDGSRGWQQPMMFRHHPHHREGNTHTMTIMYNMTRKELVAELEYQGFCVGGEQAALLHEAAETLHNSLLVEEIEDELGSALGNLEDVKVSVEYTDPNYSIEGGLEALEKAVEESEKVMNNLSKMLDGEDDDNPLNEVADSLLDLRTDLLDVMDILRTQFDDLRNDVLLAYEELNEVYDKVMGVGENN